MSTLTPEETHFLDQYVRELHGLGAGVATRQLHERGIYIGTLLNHLLNLWDQNWRLRDKEFPYPREDANEVICPWESKEQLELRAAELTSEVS